jgi:beta-lactam-binding protein with PASTA domain
MTLIEKILKSKIFKNLILAIAFMFLVITLVSLYLKAYTHHNERILTPSFKGLTIKQAQDLAKKHDIRIKIIDSIYNAYGEPGTIVDQTPKANFKIKDGRTIFLTIKAKEQRMVKMPNLNSVSLIQARSELETAGLMVGKIEYRPSQFKDLVLEQKFNGKTIAPETKIPAGSKIDLVIGQKGNGQAVVPDFTGLSRDDAGFKAAEYSLNIGNIYYDQSVVTSRDSAIAVVYKQSVDAGKIVNSGDFIDIWLTVSPQNYNTNNN